MNNKAKLEVGTWHYLPSPISHPRPHEYRRVLPPAALGMVGTLLIHAMVFQAALLGTKTIHRPEMLQPGSTLAKPAEESESRLVLVEMTGADSANRQELEKLIAADVANKKPLLIPLAPDPLPALDFSAMALDNDEAAGNSDRGDSAERARLVGIYSGQIQARINRAWSRPRSPVTATNDRSIPDDTFRCQIQIVQDNSGTVQEVLLPNCNGSAEWQRSLVIAVQQASPLPAPPNPTVFKHVITLNFVGCSYSVGAPEGEYEPAFRGVAMTDLPAPVPSR